MAGYAEVETVEQLRDALASDVWDIRITNALYFQSEAQCIYVDEIRPLHLGPSLRITGAGGAWLPGTFYRLHDGTRPLLSIGPSIAGGAPVAQRHWELRMSGLNFANQGALYRGPGLRIGYCQQSRLHDFRFEGWNDEPFHINGNGNAYSFFQLMYNAEFGRFAQNANVRLRDFVTNAAWGTGRNKGYIIEAGPHDPVGFSALGVGCSITDSHNEGCRNIVRGWQAGVEYKGGYHLAADVRFENVAGGAVHVDRTGMSWFNHSQMVINSYRFDPVRQAFLGRFYE